jgi:hypothetical protein
MKILVLFSVVPLAFIAPFVATTIVLALLTMYVYSFRRRAVEERLMEEAYRAEARRKASLQIKLS